jgi:23S rRNA pseudouridine2605 synthase
VSDRKGKRRSTPGSAADERQPRVSLPRALSKLGLCSRSQAMTAVQDGRVRVNGAVVREAAFRVDMDRDRIELDGERARAATHAYVALNKPRGLLTTRDDPRGRETVYSLLPPEIPFVAPVGRLDQASEGLLLFTNDTRWAARLTDPASHVDKTYHVQVDRLPDEALLARLRAGVEDAGELLAVKQVRELRRGGRNAWLEVVLDEGRNRHIRRMLSALGIETLRLVRVAIGPLALGTLAKGAWRYLDAGEVRALDLASRPAAEG